jgi:hypothetical protein
MWRFIKKTRARIDAGQSTAPPKNNQLFKEWIIQNPHIVVRFHSFFCLISYVLGSLRNVGMFVVCFARKFAKRQLGDFF